MAAEIIEKGIFLTFDEIRILLYGMGVAEIDGVYMPEKNFRKEEIITAIHHLSEAGFIRAGDEKFYIREDIRELLEIMAEPERTEIWRPSGQTGPAFFLYIKGERVVVSEKFWRKHDTLKLKVFEKEVFKKWREEYMDDYCGDRSPDDGEKV